MALEPGDVVACGTSLGLAPMRPPLFEVVGGGVGLLGNFHGAEGSDA